MKTFIIIVVILAVLTLAEIVRELHCFRITEYVVESEKLTGLNREWRLVFLSDLHNHVYGRDNEKLLKAVKDSAPDYILVGGDMLVGKEKSDYAPALSFVKRLVDIAPVYYANGNHEQRMKEKPDVYNCYTYAEYQRELKACGVHFLENESVYFPKAQKAGENPVKLTGLEIPRSCYRRFGKGHLEVSEITERIGEKETDAFQILLAHNPSYAETYREWGADLILSGHLHGGMVRLFGRGMVAPSFRLFPAYSGDMYQEGNTTVIVSKGLGTHSINIRLFNPAELIVVRLSNKSCGK